LGNVFREGCANFSMYYRYYVFSTTTGADHILYYRSTANTSKDLYPSLYNKHLFITRKDTAGVLEYYLNMAFASMKKSRAKIDVFEDLTALT